MQGEKALPSNMLHSRFIFKKYGSFRQFNSRVLLTCAQFMSLEPMTGLNSINGLIKIIKLTGLPIPLLDPTHWFL